jgi:8-hydroxy-5-deazaflavin:NADPH oxidoreductase
MNIGIIGSGEMGSCLASKFVELGHTVSISNSRGPASILQLADDIGATATTVAEAMSDKDFIVVAIPQKNIPDLPLHLFQQLLPEVVVVDTGNYYPTLRDGHIPPLDEVGIDSLWVQQQLGVPVVKVFNAILATSIQDLGKPRGDSGRVAIAVSGDDAHAKQLVCKLVDAMGFDTLDVGDISLSWKQQPGSSVYCRDIHIDELQKRVAAMGTDWAVMRNVIPAKRKTDEALMQADYPAYLEGLKK